MNQEGLKRVSKIVPKWSVMAALSGGLPLNPAFESLIKHNQTAEEVPIKDFCTIRPCSLEFIKAAIQAGAKLNDDTQP